MLQVVYGEGIASYMNDGGMDLAPQLTFDAARSRLSQAEAVPLTGVMAYYDHYWSDKWSSSIGYSYTEVDNTNFQDPAAYHKGQYASVNLLTYPADNLMIGAELLWGERKQRRHLRRRHAFPVHRQVQLRHQALECSAPSPTAFHGHGNDPSHLGPKLRRCSKRCLRRS